MSLLEFLIGGTIMSASIFGVSLGYSSFSSRMQGNINRIQAQTELEVLANEIKTNLSRRADFTFLPDDVKSKFSQNTTSIIYDPENVCLGLNILQTNVSADGLTQKVSFNLSSGNSVDVTFQKNVMNESESVTLHRYPASLQVKKISGCLRPVIASNTGELTSINVELEAQYLGNNSTEEKISKSFLVPLNARSSYIEVISNAN